MSLASAACSALCCVCWHWSALPGGIETPHVRTTLGALGPNVARIAASLLHLGRTGLLPVCDSDLGLQRRLCLPLPCSSQLSPSHRLWSEQPFLWLCCWSVLVGVPLGFLRGHFNLGDPWGLSVLVLLFGGSTSGGCAHGCGGEIAGSRAGPRARLCYKSSCRAPRAWSAVLGCQVAGSD